jgi:hypothetical protein
MVARARALLRSNDTATALVRLTSAGSIAPVAPEQGLSATRFAGRIVGGACLPQAVALTAMLARAGGNPELVVGSRRYPTGVWGAHAWVEMNNARLDVVPAGEHVELARFGQSSNWQAVGSPGARAMPPRNN